MTHKLRDYQISSFQITVDGTIVTHNQHRMLRGGQSTWDRIQDNLVSLKSLSENFSCCIRVNFDEITRAKIPNLIDLLPRKFATDPPFYVAFVPVGTWGGSHDRELPVIDPHQGEQVS